MTGVTVQQFFYSAYRYAGLVQREQTILADDQVEEARQVYNTMVDTWRTNGLTISHVARRTFPIQVGKGDYSMGTGGDIDVVWQERVDRVGLDVVGNSPDAEYPLYPLTLDEWKNWTVKTQQENWPNAFFYERDYPLGILHLVYVPSQYNLLVLYLEDPLGYITATQDELIDFQPGYQECLETNLAIRIAARHPGANPAPYVRQLAFDTMQQLQVTNNRPLKRTTDLTNRWRGRSNVYLGNRWS